jgi:hypothetical protein
MVGINVISLFYIVYFDLVKMAKILISNEPNQANPLGSIRANYMPKAGKDDTGGYDLS